MTSTDLDLDIPAALDRRATASYRADLDIDAIRADHRAQPRDHLDTAITTEYAEAMADGAAFPPLTVFHDGETYWLADGFHRRYAAINSGVKTLPCEIHPGGLREAILHSCGANAAHGHRRSNDDKRRAVRRMIEDEEWRQWSDREIARRCQVHHQLVAKVRAEMEPETDTGETSSMKNDKETSTFVHHKTGKPTQMDTSGLKSNGSARVGARVNVPEGMTASELCRKGLELEAGGVSPEIVSGQLGVGTNSYRKMRDIVLLSDRDDLGTKAAKTVGKALELLDETNRVGKAHELVYPIVLKIWGGERGGERTPEREQRRLESFENAVSIIVEACSHGATIEIPFLAKERTTAILDQLKEAEKGLLKFKTRIEEQRQ